MDWETLSRPSQANQVQFGIEAEYEDNTSTKSKEPVKKITPGRTKLVLGGLVFLLQFLGNK